MRRSLVLVLIQALLITTASFAVSLTSNAMRKNGIPLIADVPYDIFAPCRDSEVKAEPICAGCVAGKSDILYVDARSAEEFAAGHVEGALSAPYSVLSGASASDVAAVRRAAEQRHPSAVVVYGALLDPEDTAGAIDLAKPLTEQLVEAQVAAVRHYAGSVEELKKTVSWKVQGDSR